MVTDLSSVADRLLAEAATSKRGRAAHIIIGGDKLRVTAMALQGGEALGEHDSPAAATIQVLRGDVVLHSPDEALELSAGDIAEIPPLRHDLAAKTDAVVVLTVYLAD